MKINEKIKAIRLRKLGKSLNEIKKQINVSKGTLSLWLREIKLTKIQISRLKGRQRSGLNGGIANHRKRIQRTREIIENAKAEANRLIKNPLFLAGLMLYWAEGSDDRQERIKFSNSDPAMIKFMVKWFRNFLNVPEYRFRIGLHIHALHCRKDIESYWSEITSISLTQFHKTLIKPTSLKHRRNPLYDGTCNIIVSDKDLFRRIKGWKMKFIEKLKLTSKNDYVPL